MEINQKIRETLSAISNMWRISCIFLFLLPLITGCKNQVKTAFHPGHIWVDENNKPINAHGGCIVFDHDTYYWFGECKSDTTNVALIGISCYSSSDLYNWKNEGTALSVSNDDDSELAKGCIIERPKVVYNSLTKMYIMWFHLEPKGMNYSAAYAGVAVSNNITGPYNFIYALRPNVGYLPQNMPQQVSFDTIAEHYIMWTPAWEKAVKQGLYTYRDRATGQMSRDMTIFVDDDKRAYHIYSSEENLTLHIAELSDDYLVHTGKYIRVLPGEHNEAPTIFKRNGKYFMITSGCTGWEPNAARLSVADSIMGTWKSLSNPCIGAQAELTFNGQGTCIFPVVGKQDSYIFMADRWTPNTPCEGTYIWLPMQFAANDVPYLEWFDSWNLDFFKDAPEEVRSYAHN